MAGEFYDPITFFSERFKQEDWVSEDDKIPLHFMLPVFFELYVEREAITRRDKYP